VDRVPLLRLSASAAVREQRLAALAAERDPHHTRARAAVEEAQARGSLELAGVEPDAAAVRRLAAAARAVPPGARLDAGALLAWHRAAVGAQGFRVGARGGGAPADRIEGRLAVLEEWLEEASARELRPAQQGALALARVAEIAPFEDGNGRVARLAAAHVMARAGARPPLLAAGDAERLRTAVAAAFALDTAPLVALLEEAAERALDVALRALEGLATR
jgi:hypothetical protein